MRTKTSSLAELFLVFLSSLLPRVLGALWLPNAFGDAYAYTEQIYYMRRAMLSNSFSASSMFGFWLPLYQVICAGISAFTGGPFYVPKLVSAVCGAGVCVMVFIITRELTSSRWLAVASAVIVALNPLHISYSSSAMTDVPHAFLILLCAFCCIRNRWLWASLFALGAGLMRIESWTLILIIPVAQAIRQRKVSPLALLVLVAGPAFWLYVSWKASGDIWKYFKIRNTYILETLAGSPWLASFAPQRVGLDLLRLVYTSNPIILMICLALAFSLWKKGYDTGSHPISKIFRSICGFVTVNEGLLLCVYFSHLAFLLFAYFTRNQPDIWPRYGLIFFALGLPLLAVKFSSLVNDGTSGPGWWRNAKAFKRLAYATALIMGIQFSAQLIDVTRTTVRSDAHVVTAQFLEDQRSLDGSAKIYCEDGTIRVLSGIPLEDFRDQYNSPAYRSSSDLQAFTDSLKDNEVQFLVYKDLPGSHLREIVSKLRANPGFRGLTLEEVTPRPRNKRTDEVTIYRVHGLEYARLVKRTRKRQ